MSAAPASHDTTAGIDAGVDQLRRQQKALSLAGDPVGWASSLDVLLWSKQQEIMLALEEHNRVAVRSCHDSGKSFVASVIAARWLDTHPHGQARVITTAPTMTQVRGILWVEINQLHERAGLPGRVNQTEWWIGSYLAGLGRKPGDYRPEAFQGLHARYILIVIDEASGVPASIIDAAETLATNVNARILMIGNPDDPSSEFAKVHADPDKYGYHTIKISAWDTPNFTAEGDLLLQHGEQGQLLTEVLLSPMWVEQRKRVWGIDHPFWASKVEAEFPSQDAMAIVPLPALLQASVPFADRESPVQPTTFAARPDVLGVDVAGSETGDETVIRLVRHGHMVAAEWRGRSSDPSIIADLVDAAQVQCGAAIVNVDAIGVGWGVCGLVRERFAVRFAGSPSSAPVVVALNSSASPTTPQAKLMYGNLRAQLWWEFRLALQQGLIDTSAADNRMDLEAQLLMPRYHINKGKIWVEAKEDIKQRLGRSPDNADALMYALHQARGAGIARVSSPSTRSLGARLPRTSAGSAGFAPRLINVGRHS
jgi:hypothetical protein